MAYKTSEDIQELIRILKSLSKLKWSTSFSVVKPALDLLIETSLVLAHSLEQEIWETQRTNPKVIFNYKKSDSLGNPLSFSVFEKQIKKESPQLHDYFLMLAEDLVSVKRNMKPPSLYMRGKVSIDAKSSKSSPKRKRTKTQKNFWYFKRRALKKRSQRK